MHTKKRDFDKAAATWDEKPDRVRLANDIAMAIVKNIPLNPQMDALDFGCGTGLLTLRLQPLVRSITGVDSSRGMLDVLEAKVKEQKLSNVRTQYVDLDRGDTLESGYHLIVSSMTLHHVQDIQSLLAHFYHVAAPSGCLCIADLDPDDGQFHKNNEGIFHFGFDRTRLREAFMEAGFVDVHDVTAAEVERADHAGNVRTFTVFLVMGRKGGLP